MPLEYHYNAQERLVEIRCYGTLVIDEIARYFADLAEDESVALGAVELVDLSDVALFDVDFNEAAAMPEEYALAWGRKRILGTLLFGTNDLNEGLAHLIKAHFNRTLPSHFFAVVASREAARDEARRLLEKAG